MIRVSSNEMTQVGKILKGWRGSIGYSQESLSEKAGCHVGTIGNIERGRTPRIALACKTIFLYAKAFRLDPSYLAEELYDLAEEPNGIRYFLAVQRRDRAGSQTEMAKRVGVSLTAINLAENWSDRCPVTRGISVLKGYCEALSIHWSVFIFMLFNVFEGEKDGQQDKSLCSPKG